MTVVVSEPVPLLIKVSLKAAAKANDEVTVPVSVSVSVKLVDVVFVIVPSASRPVPVKVRVPRLLSVNAVTVTPWPDVVFVSVLLIVNALVDVDKPIDIGAEPARFKVARLLSDSVVMLEAPGTPSGA